MEPAVCFGQPSKNLGEVCHVDVVADLALLNQARLIHRLSEVPAGLSNVLVGASESGPSPSKLGRQSLVHHAVGIATPVALSFRYSIVMSSPVA